MHFGEIVVRRRGNYKRSRTRRRRRWSRSKSRRRRRNRSRKKIRRRRRDLRLSFVPVRRRNYKFQRLYLSHFT